MEPNAHDQGSAPQPVRAEAVAVPARPPALPRRRRWAPLLVIVLLAGLAGSLLLNLVLVGSLGITGTDRDRRVRERFYSHEPRGRDKVAILSLEGVILDTDGFFKRQINRAADDENVRAVVVRVDSGGGSVAASDHLYYHLNKLREESEIPVVVSMGGIAASGAYYVSMAVGETPDSIYAEPATWTGSIGVVMPRYDISGLLEEWNIAEDSIVSHPMKVAGSMARPLDEEERRYFQELVDESFHRFKEVIRAGRPRFREDQESLERIATGKVFTAEQAREVGLVDRIGFVEDAVERAIELAGLDPDRVRVVEYRREPSLADLFFPGLESRSALPDASTLSELSTPRPYFIFSALPGVGSLDPTALAPRP